MLIAIISSYAFAGENLSLCTDGLTAPNPYVIEQGELISANSDIYLESNGTQYINTEIIPTQNTRIVAKIEVLNQNNYNWIFGVINRATLGKESCYGVAINGSRFYSEISGTNKTYGNTLTYGTPYEFDFTVTEITTPSGTYETGATTLAQTEIQMYMFANNAGGGATYDQRFIGRIYYFKIYENEELIRHFVPVPTGLQIGDFIVPSNGMWDLVEQKFYNTVTGRVFAFGDKTCAPCPAHQYYENDACHDCPINYTDDKTVGKVGISDCKIFCTGGYIANKYDTTCTDPGAGYWAPRGYISYGQTSIPYKCPDGTTTAGFGAAADESEDCGHILWVNNSPIYLRQSRKTKPALNIKMGNTIFYGSATPVQHLFNITNFNDKKLYVKLNDVTYLVHDDRLYSNMEFNENTYLGATGLQYIDTEYTPSAQTTIEATIMTTGKSGYNWFFGNIDRTNFGKYSCFGLAQYNGQYYSEISGSNKTYAPMPENIKHTVKFSISEIQVDDTTITTGASDTTYIPAQFSMCMFANCSERGNTYDSRFIGRIYNFKVYENGELVRYFVPVRKDQMIEKFIVPANGMWDMVEQKFYGNIGDGDFTYGTDL